MPNAALSLHAQYLQKKAFMDSLSRIGDRAKDMAGQAGDYIKDTNPGDPRDVLRTMMLSGLGGAALGGVGNVIGNIGQPEEEQGRRRGVLGSMATGGLLGAGAGASMPLLASLMKRLEGGSGSGGKGPDVNNITVNNTMPEAPRNAPDKANPAIFDDNTFNPDRQGLQKLLKEQMPMNTTGRGAGLLNALMPSLGLGNVMAHASANGGLGNLFSGTSAGELGGLVAKPTLLTALGGLLGRKAKGGNNIRMMGGMLAGNALGSMWANRSFSNQQGEKYSDATHSLMPPAFWQDKNLPGKLKLDLMERDPSKLLEAVRQAPEYIPQRHMPDAFKLVQALQPANQDPRWYDPS